jgi:serine/threonine protein phosphatase 1
MFNHFNINETGRDFVVGDIHGCFDQLRTALLSVDFLYDTDRLFCVGDLVDRGPNSEECIEWLQKPWFYSIRGNHEQMAIDYLAGSYATNIYLANGGAWFIGLTHIEQIDIVNEFIALPIALDIQTKNGLIGLVHAECPVNDWTQLEIEFAGISSRIYIEICIWYRTRFNCNITSLVDNVAQIYVGHTPTLEPKQLGNVNYIDTGAVFGNKLTIIQIN